MAPAVDGDRGEEAGLMPWAFSMLWPLGMSWSDLRKLWPYRRVTDLVSA